MASPKRRRRPRRVRIGDVTLYQHHGAAWIYFRDRRRPVRRRIGKNFDEAKAVAAQVNAQLALAKPTMFSFEPVTVGELARRWLEHHEDVLRSSVATCARYRTAVEHLSRYAEQTGVGNAHKLAAEDFARHLRAIRVHPNGHAHSEARPLRDKGVKFILAACRAMYNYAAKHRLLPPYYENPFAALPIDRMRIEDPKPIHIFSANDEAAFLQACDPWALSVFYILSKVGLRSGELTHLLVEDVDLDAGLLHIRDKAQLGWKVKTRNARSIPLPAEPLAVLRPVIGQRVAGVLFLRRRFLGDEQPALQGMTTPDLVEVLNLRTEHQSKQVGRSLSRDERRRIAAVVWRDAGAIKTDKLRTEFMQITKRIGLPEVTAPKCWRHTFATLMQEANVDPLIRQLTMGHVPGGAGRSALGATATYTHTKPAVHREQLQRLINLRPKTSEIVAKFLGKDPEEHSDREI